MARRLFLTATALVLFSSFGLAGPSEYNGAGRDMYGNTLAQNEAIRLRGVEEKAVFAQKASLETSENYAVVRSLIPGAIFLTVLVIAGAVVCRARG